MQPFAMYAALATAVAVVGLVFCESRDLQAGSRIAKPVASLGFIVTGVAAGALESAFGIAIMVGLVLSAAGDVFLLSRDSPTWFLAGLGSFLTAHVAYVVAFGVLGTSWTVSLGAAVLLSPLAYYIWRWLSPHLARKPSMKKPVVAYITVITSMVACALGAAYQNAAWLVLAGAVLFFLSDLAVARERFVKQTFINRLWGLPVYYLAQILLALSVQP